MALQARKLIPYALAGWLPGGRRYCVLCEHKVWRFMPYRRGVRSVSPLMRALDVVGSDVEHFECPRCGSHDRERHLALYMRAVGMFDRLSGMRVLHFAPERRLRRQIAATSPVEHVCCDLYPNEPGIQKVDIERMPFADASFDLVIANHVLEHVDDDLRAVREVHRVLAPGGSAILQAPFSRVLQRTWSDPGIASPAARLQAFGQEDHVRLFGADFVERVASSGLKPRVASHADLLAGVDAGRFGVNPDEPFLLFER
jgi:hypothetical protein